MKVLAIALVVASLSACGSPSSSCVPVGQPCGPSHVPAAGDCCPGLFCIEGACSTQMCNPAGQPCLFQGDCCSGTTCSLNHVCMGTCNSSNCTAGCCDSNGLCQTGTTNASCGVFGVACKACLLGQRCTNHSCQSPPPNCTTAGKPCSTSATCCTNLTCSRFVSSCTTASGLAIGEPCDADSQCASGMCAGWCTKPCGSDADCTPNVSYCVMATTGYLCFPWCGPGSNTNCSVYGSGVTCQGSTSVGGVSTEVCSS